MLGRYFGREGTYILEQIGWEEDKCKTHADLLGKGYRFIEADLLEER